MKPQARRITLAAAVLGAAILAVLVVLNWSTVRDHVEAWHFQLSGETVTLVADPVWQTLPFDARPGFRKLTTEDIDSLSGVEIPAGDQEAVIGEFDALFHILANTAGCPVIYSREEVARDDMKLHVPVSRVKSVRAKDVLKDLGRLGYRVLEQRFPRRAYVVISGEEPTPR